MWMFWAQFLEYTRQILRPVYTYYIKYGGISRVGVCVHKNRCHADFRRLQDQCQILSLIQGARNRLGIIFCVLTHQCMICLHTIWLNPSLPAKYGGQTTIIPDLTPKPVCAQKTPQKGAFDAHARFWLSNTKYWEFSDHISLANVSRGP